MLKTSVNAKNKQINDLKNTFMHNTNIFKNN